MYSVAQCIYSPSPLYSVTMYSIYSATAAPGRTPPAGNLCRALTPALGGAPGSVLPMAASWVWGQRQRGRGMRGHRPPLPLIPQDAQRHREEAAGRLAEPPS
ncbi:zona pellucida sperm-binding protein 3-like [Platysternon megacephalum]|uniref:Zona pellucida sperm-binding protein 3-like n=1 Tax=Platysternon megacephalum TaxID=55544 RepID=A0A4D9DWF7_9SAUR|nr:zona pellucida sperm-binding protein 3-like [Platysternon megacephalum]